MATPKSARRIRKNPRLGAKPEANSSREEAKNVDHQHRPAAEAVGGKAKDKCADRSCRQSEEDREGDVLHICAEFFRDVVHDEDENEEIESIKRPAKVARQDRVALFGREVTVEAQHAFSLAASGSANKTNQACHFFDSGSV